MGSEVGDLSPRDRAGVRRAEHGSGWEQAWRISSVVVRDVEGSRHVQAVTARRKLCVTLWGADTLKQP